MGVLSGKDLYSSKWITANITDSSDRLWVVPIKHTLGDYFLADIDGKVYCFKIHPGRIKTYYHTLVKSFRILQYDTNHYMPISSADCAELGRALKVNSLPKMNRMLFNIMKLLGQREKEEFTPHVLQDLVEEVGEHEEQYKEQVLNIKNYLSHLRVDQILTPVRRITDFIQEDLLATDAGFMGDVVSHYQRTDLEHKKVTNTPITGKVAWMKWMLIIGFIVIIALIFYIAYDNGWFDPILNAGKSLEGFQGINFGAPPGSTDAEFAAKYPTPEAAKAALDRGELHESQIPPAMRELVKNVKTPEAIPTP